MKIFWSTPLALTDSELQTWKGYVDLQIQPLHFADQETEGQQAKVTRHKSSELPATLLILCHGSHTPPSCQSPEQHHGSKD